MTVPVLYGDNTAQAVHNAMDDGQAHARSAVFPLGRKERIEDAADMIRRDAVPGILNGQFDISAGLQLRMPVRKGGGQVFLLQRH